MGFWWLTLESIAIVVPPCHKPMCSWEDFLEVVYSGRKYCRSWATKRSLTRWMIKGLIWKLHTGRCAVFLLLGMRLVLKPFLGIRHQFFWEATKMIQGIFWQQFISQTLSKSRWYNSSSRPPYWMVRFFWCILLPQGIRVKSNHAKTQTWDVHKFLHGLMIIILIPTKKALLSRQNLMHPSRCNRILGVSPSKVFG